MNLDWKNYRLHSLCSGGTSLATYSDVSHRFFKPHVRWKPESKNYGYAKDRLGSLLSVSKNLATLHSLQKLPLLLGTQEHGSTSRKLSFSFTHPIVEENK